MSISRYFLYFFFPTPFQDLGLSQREKKIKKKKGGSWISPVMHGAVLCIAKTQSSDTLSYTHPYSTVFHCNASAWMPNSGRPERPAAGGSQKPTSATWNNRDAKISLAAQAALGVRFEFDARASSSLLFLMGQVSWLTGLLIDWYRRCTNVDNNGDALGFYIVLWILDYYGVDLLSTSVGNRLLPMVFPKCWH